MSLGQPQNSRRSDRRESDEPSTLRGPGGLPVDAHVHDISPHGFLCEAKIDLSLGDGVTLGLGGHGSADAVVRWRDGERYGCEFLHPIRDVAQLARLSGDVVAPDRFRRPAEAPVFVAEAAPGSTVPLAASGLFCLLAGTFAAHMLGIV